MEPIYSTYKPAWKSFYKLWFLFALILVLAILGSYYGPLVNHRKWLWIIAVIVEVFIFIYIAMNRSMTSLILRDNPDKSEDQEVAFIVCHPLKPFSSDFRESIEISLANITHIKVGQNLMQTLFGIGDIVITSSGTSGEEIKAPNIPNPQQVRDEIQICARRYTMPNPTPTLNMEQPQQ